MKPYISRLKAQSFWTRSLFLKVGDVREELDYAMDRDLLIRFMEQGATFKFLRQTLGNLSMSQWSENLLRRLS